MRPILFSLFTGIAMLFLPSKEAKAQIADPTNTYIKFTYDAAGNRIQRRIIISNDPNHQRKRAVAQQLSSKDSLGSASVSIYPNPTPGMLTVELHGQNSTLTNAVLYDNVGKQVFMKNNIDGIQNIDLYSLSAGHYKLLLTNGSNTGIWKIVKE